MADRTEVSLDEQIANLRAKLTSGDYPLLAAIASLLELQRIRAAERPEPVAWGKWSGAEGRMLFSQLEPSHHGPEWLPLYGPEVLDYADKVRAERDVLKRILIGITCS